jgi:hypothetical protein
LSSFGIVRLHFGQGIDTVEVRSSSLLAYHFSTLPQCHLVLVEFSISRWELQRQPSVVFPGVNFLVIFL